VRVGKEKVEASLKDAQMELEKNRETLKNQTEQTEKLSKEVREGGKGEEEGRGKGAQGGTGEAPTQLCISTPKRSSFLSWRH